MIQTNTAGSWTEMQITDPFPNFNGAAVDVWERISNYISHFIFLYYLSMLGLTLDHVNDDIHTTSHIRIDRANNSCDTLYINTFKDWIKISRNNYFWILASHGQCLFHSSAQVFLYALPMASLLSICMHSVMPCEIEERFWKLTNLPRWKI